MAYTCLYKEVVIAKGFAVSLYSPFFFHDYYELVERGMKCNKSFFSRLVSFLGTRVLHLLTII